jgi:hypothetical protein
VRDWRASTDNHIVVFGWVSLAAKNVARPLAQIQINVTLGAMRGHEHQENRTFRFNQKQKKYEKAKPYEELISPGTIDSGRLVNGRLCDEPARRVGGPGVSARTTNCG